MSLTGVWREELTGRHSVSLLWVLARCAVSSFEALVPLVLLYLSLVFSISGPRGRRVRREI